MVDIDDPALLKRAVVLLLDKKYGENRENKVREAIRRLPKFWIHFRGIATPLNYLVELVVKKPEYTLNVLNLLFLARSYRSKLWEKLDASDPSAKYKGVRKDCMRDYRIRCNAALETEEHRIGRKLTAEEATALLARKRAEWKKLAANYKIAHEGMRAAQGQLAKATKEHLLRRELRLRDEALQKPKGFGLATEKKLKKLERKFRS